MIRRVRDAVHRQLEAFARGAERTWEMTALTFKMIVKIVTGQASIKNITGPIAIADYAGQTARLGLATFLGFIAVVSVGSAPGNFSKAKRGIFVTT